MDKYSNRWRDIVTNKYLRAHRIHVELMTGDTDIKLLDSLILVL